MADELDRVSRLEAIEAIKQLKARYFRAMDTKDWDAFAEGHVGCFNSDSQTLQSERVAERRPRRSTTWTNTTTRHWDWSFQDGLATPLT